MSRRTRKVVVRESTGSRVLERSRLRLLCVALFFALCFGSIGGRLIGMMIHSHRSAAPAPASSSPVEEAEDAEVKGTEQHIKRGDIVDRNGVLLATSLMTESAFANAREISNPEAAAQALSRTLGISQSSLLKRLRSKKNFVWVKRQLTPAEQQKVNDLGIPGIYFTPEERRVYPYGNMFAHLVGYVGTDNNGLGGIEQSFDSRLSDEHLNRQPLTLSADLRIQHILRDEMQAAVNEFQAIGATGVVLDVDSGEILAMSSLPDFDPNRPAKAKDDQKFNRAALGTYEMGSTFKSFTFAMALDGGVTNLKGGYDATNPLKYGNFTISDAHSKKRWLSVPEIYAYSSNVGTARMLLDAGVKRQREFLQKIGMLAPIETELPERAQPLYPRDWQTINAITISYGHGLSVTPLHLVRGIATLVNGGTLEALTVLKNGNEDKRGGERIISEETSRAMRRLMRMVVKHGTAGKADIAGYRVGGKTGTAEKVNAGGGYNRDNKMASFIGVFPMDRPKYAVLVMVDEPKGNKSTYGFATGGWIAAPAVGRVIERMGPIISLKPEYNVADDDAEKYWYSTEKKPAQQVAKPASPFLHAATFQTR